MRIAIIGGGAVHVAERARPAVVHSSKSTKAAPKLESDLSETVKDLVRRPASSSGDVAPAAKKMIRRAESHQRKTQAQAKTQSEAICILDTDENGVHDLQDDEIPSFRNKTIEVSWLKHEYEKIEIRGESGLSWNDKVGTGYRYEVPIKARHLFQPGIYTYRLINEYNPHCKNLVGRFRITSS